MQIEVNNSGDNNKIVLGKDELKKIRSKPDEELTREELLQKLKSEKSLILKLLHRKTKYLAAIAIFLFGSISVFTWNELKTYSEKDTFNKYYKIYSERKSDEYGLKSFVEKNYTEAIKRIPDTVIIDGRMIKAISLIESKEYRMAVKLLSDIGTQDAQWLKALCLLRVEDHMQAIKEFEDIYKAKGLYASAAKEILEKHYYGYSSYKKN